MSMMNFQNPDQQLKDKVKKEYEKSVQNISFPDDVKELVFSSISEESCLKKSINKLSLFTEYEIKIPIKASLVCVLVVFIMFFYLFFQQLHVSKEDITAAKIHYINSVSDLGGHNDTN